MALKGASESNVLAQPQAPVGGDETWKRPPLRVQLQALFDVIGTPSARVDRVTFQPFSNELKVTAKMLQAFRGRAGC